MTQNEAPAGKRPKKYGWLDLMNGNSLQSKGLIKQLPFILVVVMHLLLLVGNRYQVESLLRDREREEERIKYLNETQIEMRKHYQETIKMSELVEMLSETGVGITAGPPFEI